nr:uncharacterized protein LOC123571139 [Macaca fascicularis]
MSQAGRQPGRGARLFPDRAVTRERRSSLARWHGGQAELVLLTSQTVGVGRWAEALLTCQTGRRPGRGALHLLDGAAARQRHSSLPRWVAAGQRHTSLPRQWGSWAEVLLTSQMVGSQAEALLTSQAGRWPGRGASHLPNGGQLGRGASHIPDGGQLRLAFISQITQAVCQALGTQWNLHIPYHPQSSGKVEQTNDLLKTYLTKLSLQLKKGWTVLSPLALLRIRACPRDATGCSPFELLYGCSFLLGPCLIPDTSPLVDYLPVLQQAKQEIRQAPNLLLPTPDSQPYEDTLAGRSVLAENLTPQTLQP